MAKKKQVKTNAIRIVEQKKIPYQEHTYTFSEDDLGAKHVAEELNQNEAQIFKTLVAVGNKTGPVVAVIPSNQELDLKKIAKESGNKKVEMLHLKDLESLTGYIRGGCSPAVSYTHLRAHETSHYGISRKTRFTNGVIPQ